MRRAKAHQSLHPGDLSPVAPPPMPSPVHSKQDDESAARGHDVSVGADSGADAPTEQEMKRQSVDAFNAGLRCFKAKEWGAAASHFTIAIDFLLKINLPDIPHKPRIFENFQVFELMNF